MARDALITNNDLVMNADGSDLVFVDGVDEMAQHLRTELSTQQGTHSRSADFGVPYREQILVRAPNTTTIADIFRGTISRREDVLSVPFFRIDFDKATRELDVEFKANTTEGLVSVSETL